jgi:hypothetical protein
MKWLKLNQNNALRQLYIPLYTFKFFCSPTYNPHSADTKANLGIKNLEKVKPEKIAEQRFQAFIC